MKVVLHKESTGVEVWLVNSDGDIRDVHRASYDYHGNKKDAMDEAENEAEDWAIFLDCEVEK